MIKYYNYIIRHHCSSCGTIDCFNCVSIYNDKFVFKNYTPKKKYKKYMPLKI